MNNKEQQIPAIRFKGFTDAWEQRKLGEVADYYDGTHQTPTYTNHGVKFISVENIRNIHDSNKYISKQDYEKQFKIKPQINDIFMTRITAGIIGDTALLEQDAPLAYYVSLALIRSKFVNPLFLEKYIGSPFFKKELHKRIIHTAFPKKINLGEIGECGVIIPNSLTEQIKVGLLFKKLDDTIALHQRQLNKYNKLKKTLLQKMFPKSGAKSPEIRFDGFTEEWKQCKLDQIVVERNQQVQESIDFPLMSFTAKDGVTPKSDRYNREFLVKSDNKKYKKTELGDLIYSSNNLDVGSIGINKTGNALISPVYSIFYTRDGITPEFVDMLIQQKDFINKMIQFRQGVVYGQWRIHESDFLKIETRIPSSKEQIKMGALFKQIDNTIAFHQQKVNDYQKLKEALLKKMFI